MFARPRPLGFGETLNFASKTEKGGELRFCVICSSLNLAIGGENQLDEKENEDGREDGKHGFFRRLQKGGGKEDERGAENGSVAGSQQDRGRNGFRRAPYRNQQIGRAHV